MNIHPHGERLSAYIDDMLDVAQMRSVALHLGECSACRDACRSLQETRQLLRVWGPPPAPAEDFWTNAYREMRVATRERASARTWGETLREGLLGTHKRWAAGAAAAAIFTAAIIAPLVSNSIHPTIQSAVISASNAPDVVDFSTLVHDHTQSAASQPLADGDRQTMLSADVDDLSAAGETSAEAAGNGSSLGDTAP